MKYAYIILLFPFMLSGADFASKFANFETAIKSKFKQFQDNVSNSTKAFESSVNGKFDSWSTNCNKVMNDFESNTKNKLDSTFTNMENQLDSFEKSVNEHLDETFDTTQFDKFKEEIDNTCKKTFDETKEDYKTMQESLKNDVGETDYNDKIASDADTLKSTIANEGEDLADSMEEGSAEATALDEAQADAQEEADNADNPDAVDPAEVEGNVCYYTLRADYWGMYKIKAQVTNGAYHIVSWDVVDHTRSDNNTSSEPYPMYGPSVSADGKSASVSYYSYAFTGNGQGTAYYGGVPNDHFSSNCYLSGWVPLDGSGGAGGDDGEPPFDEEGGYDEPDSGGGSGESGVDSDGNGIPDDEEVPSPDTTVSFKSGIPALDKLIAKLTPKFDFAPNSRSEFSLDIPLDTSIGDFSFTIGGWNTAGGGVVSTIRSIIRNISKVAFSLFFILTIIKCLRQW